ncbi:MAG: nitroreductase family protein [Bacteroidetes bacterium]|nr:nitroreductase family protein [Bacteroidota bacterium]
MHKEAFDQIVDRRRSNRNFDPAVSVPDPVIERSLKRSILSPNSSNMQLWEFYWIQSPELKSMITEYCLRQGAACTAKHLVVFVTRQDLWKKRANWNYRQIKEAIGDRTPNSLEKRGLDYYKKLMPLIYRKDWLGIATLLRRCISFFLSLKKPFYRASGTADQRIMVHKSCALAAQTFMLSIAAEGFDSCPMEGFDRVRVRKALGLPLGAEINMIIGVGMGTPEGTWGERKRVPYEEVVFTR